MADYLILAINPGSTSTKIALFRNEEQLFKETIPHAQETLDGYPTLMDQVPLRLGLILDSLARHGHAPEELATVMGRGGMLPPVHTGGYRVNQRMLDLLRDGTEVSPHASNLGAVLAHEVARMAGVEAYIYDAVSASDFPPIAQVTGLPEVMRKSFCHVLNSRAVAIRYAREQGKAYGEMNLLVAHLGGGITVSVHQNGKIVDSLADDNGPFAPERAGSLPLLEIIAMCYSGKHTREEMIRKIRGRGGLRAHLGTSDGRAIEEMVKQGNEKATFMVQAQAYQIAKGVGELAPMLKGRCQAILLTGSLAYFSYLIELVREYIDFIAPVVVIPGEFEAEALAAGGLRILRGEEIPREM